MKGTRLVWMLLGIPVLLVALLYWRFSAPPELSEEKLREQGFWLHSTTPVVQFPAIPDHRGGEFSRQDLQGKWTWIFFGYTHCPDICGPSMVQMKKARELLLGRHWSEDELQMLMVAVDPERDTVEAMQRFLADRNPQALGLLPNHALLKNLAVTFHASYGQPRSGLVDHTGNIMLVDPAGRYMGFFRAPTTVDRLAAVSELMRKVSRQPS